MPLPANLNVALKEWAVVCNALATGKQMLLLRKGGISESIGGFEIEHREFLFFPTYLHQNATMLKPAQRAALIPASAEPQHVRITAAGQITDILRVSGRPAMDRLRDQHIWDEPLIDMRFNYRPQNPLYLLLVRAYVLPREIEIENTIAYAGCKSWVPLERPLELSGATPVLSDPDYAERRAVILQRLETPAT